MAKTAHDLAREVTVFMAQNPDEAMIVLQGVVAGFEAALKTQRTYASACDQAMMAALALAGTNRLPPDLKDTLAQRVALNLLPAAGRSQIEKEAIKRGVAAAAKAIEARQGGDGEAGSVHESATA